MNLSFLVKDALYAFQNMELEKFDALVGENACQIRAAQVSELARNYLEKKSSLYENIRKCLEQPTLYQSDPDLFTLVAAYTLTITKTQTTVGYIVRERTFPSALVGVGQMSKTAAKQLVEGTKRQLAQGSVDYVQNKAKGTKLQFFVSPPFVKKDSLPMIPCYFGIKALLKEQPYVVVKCNQYNETFQSFIGVHTLLYIFKPSGKPKHTFVAAFSKPASSEGVIEEKGSVLSEMMNMPVFVVEGYCANDQLQLSDLVTLPLKKMVLMNAAQHMQYAGTQKGEEIPFDPLEGDRNAA